MGQSSIAAYLLLLQMVDPEGGSTVGTEAKLTVAELDELFRNHGDELYAYARSLSKDPDTASDLVQSAFARFIPAVQEGRIVRSSAIGYLMRTVRNLYFTEHGRAGRTTDLKMDIPDDPGANERLQTSAEIRKVFLESLNSGTVPPEVAEILRLRFLKQMPVDELCKKVPQSRATVYRLMEQGLRVLAREFENADLSLADLN